jgi:tetratricopeptide (TPR) repeat protein
MARRWKAAELTYLKRYAKGRTVDELRKRFRTTAPVVEEKLEELGLSAKDSFGPSRLANDPQVMQLEKGVKQLHAEKWREAGKIFTQVAENSDVASVAQKARRYAAMCEQKLKKGRRKKATDPFLEAVYERNRGNLEAALEICSRGGRRSKDERFAYLAAAIHAVREELDEAARFLQLAIELNPGNRVHAHHDTDFAALRSHPEHSAIFKLP